MKTKNEKIEKITNDLLFIFSNDRDLQKLQFARDNMHEYFEQKNVDDDCEMIMNIDTIIESLNETNEIAIVEFIDMIEKCYNAYYEMHDKYDENHQRLSKRINSIENVNKKCIYVFDNIDLIDNIIDNNALTHYIKMYKLNYVDCDDFNEFDDIDDYCYHVIKQIENVLKIKIYE